MPSAHGFTRSIAEGHYSCGRDEPGPEGESDEARCVRKSDDWTALPYR